MKRPVTLTALLVLTACAEMPSVTQDATPALYPSALAAPADAEAGTCWDKTETPALVQSVTENVLIQPAQISATGTIQAPPIYRTQTRQVILQERQIRWFQVLCQQDLTPEFTASIQRALALRGLYTGAITGALDQNTRTAIKRFQINQAISAADHRVLTIEGARKLGLWATGRQDMAANT